MSNFIPLSVPNITGSEQKYVNEALSTQWVSTGGEFINRFEKEIAEYLNVPMAVSCQSGTAGLHLSMVVSDVGYGDEVIVPTLTFIAAINPVKYVGAEPVFMDCDESLCMDMKKLEEFCREECNFDGKTLSNKKTNRPIKAVVVVHVFGNMADIESAVEICNKYNLVLIEDATEALGTYFTEGKYKGKFAGTIGDIGVYSFNGNKVITTGGGGMLVAKDIEKAKRVKYLSTQAKDDQINFFHGAVGYNYRMTNIQAAMGVAQLERLEEFIETKRVNYLRYKEEINNDKMCILDFTEGIRPNYWFYALLMKNCEKDSTIKYFSDNDVQTRPIWGLIHEQKPYMSNQSYKIEKAKYYFDRVVNIPCSSNLSLEDVKRIIGLLKLL